jgi:hypothetical protein
MTSGNRNRRKSQKIFQREMTPQMENKQQETFKCGCQALLQRQKRFCTTIDQTGPSKEHAARGHHLRECIKKIRRRRKRKKGQSEG